MRQKRVTIFILLLVTLLFGCVKRDAALDLKADTKASSKADAVTARLKIPGERISVRTSGISHAHGGEKRHTRLGESCTIGYAEKAAFTEAIGKVQETDRIWRPADLCRNYVWILAP
ncbi:MAG: hypothetical protein J6P39_01835 [Oscillospiraceae bacterium]|nr:hypothetical protein [Oscillospiraceae bacterium]